MIEFLAAGWCRHPECTILRGGSWRPVTLPAGVALIHHPRLGPILFDTGYSHRFFEATQPFPERLYRWLTPSLIPPGSTVVEQLATRGIRANDVSLIILSHLHADHIAGILDFPKARVVLHADALQVTRQRGRWRNLLHGVLPALLPHDLDTHTHALVHKDFSPCGPGGLPAKDFFDDGSLLLVALPGHADGHLGLYLNPGTSAPILFVGDAAWTSAAITDHRNPSILTALITASHSQTMATLTCLHQLHTAMPEIRIIPSHCPSCWPSPPQQLPLMDNRPPSAR